MEDKIIYEVLRVIDGKPIFLENHLERMKNSFKLINKEFTLKYDEISAKINRLIQSENKTEGNIKLTYGINEKVLRVFFIQHSYPSEDLYEHGVETILYFGERENPNAKIVNDNFREKVSKEITASNAFEAILVDRNGYITEGSKSNIFMVKDGELLTSPTKAVLPGVTRGEIIKIAEKLGIRVKEVEYRYDEINKLDGMFISGTSPKVLPINKVDNVELNQKNDIIINFMKEYDNEIKKYIKCH
ncbi:aminotransferase class IV [Clostridium saccharobutylicum]|uniref:Aminotransferase class IV n=1 Tax=Clostridium saccharobutylicum DSM 13864 TaxID=1345695 RepID=U5MZ76_CLOSA|nr:aminotransferase class IV [Clostridium saccharobutylicum]AGX44946.1 aminotransferase class IV [Clostridium saccharobutylicum DSM 13864]AQR92228.1 branched-chain-amino-acid aminotransferase [Clostridium saccharobutylicum]AQS02130.1 branched-chain-amino-acid aminotransferase [Clostridium saccharobutylicum]AQS11734.1 branched-chain-amino-acid aminotransferase [Clostridium saccharobutylicum]AQS16113.1 branched-chain-amino-acid aminotransferase [Clostridium saccharobutylicum]